MFPVYDGKCLSRKAVHIWVEEFSQGRSKVADDSWPDAEVADTTFMLRASLGQVYQRWWRICREVNGYFFFQIRISHDLRSMANYDMFTDSPDRLCGLVVRVPDYRCRGPGFDSLHYQIF
jgi:hypothetical protein